MQTYFKRYILLSCSLMALTAFFNWVVDPYGLYLTFNMPGVNAYKPEFSSHLRMSKATAVQFIKPRGIVLGSSRADTGLNPAHPGWNTAPVYNLGLTGANIYEIQRYLQHAQAIQSLDKVVLGLDFFMFNVHYKNQPDFDESRLAVMANGEPNLSLNNDIINTLFSLDALRASWHTVTHQDSPPEYFPNGQVVWTYNLTRTRQTGGYAKAFELSLASHRDAAWFPPPNHQFSFVDPATGVSSFDSFRKIIQLAHREKIQLYLFISPDHASLLDELRAAGLWPVFEEWKRSLVQINEMEAELQSAETFPLWDFSGYNSVTTEAPPPLGDLDTQMQGYWEAIHYKTEVGDLPFDRNLMTMADLTGN